jgi:hypothetical protein
VFDFTQAVAGPTATLMLAEMGAEVIKVELMPNGDLTRAIPLIRNGRSGYFVQHNRGKKSICVDVKNPKGLALIKGLIPQMDVLMENFAPGVIGRLGLDYPAIKALNPRIVMCSLSAFGQTGPLANEPGFDTLGAAYAPVLRGVHFWACLMPTSLVPFAFQLPRLCRPTIRANRRFPSLSVRITCEWRGRTILESRRIIEHCRFTCPHRRAGRKYPIPLTSEVKRPDSP